MSLCSFRWPVNNCLLADEIRPDWEDKLNAVKAAAARKAARRIVMRQVGDRLVPIGYTSSRATGQADFSMSTGSGDSSSRSERRRGSNGRDLEELMIMEAMRLSMLDHDEHQRRQAQGTQSQGQNSRDGTQTAPSPNASTAPPSPRPGSSSPRRSHDKRKFSLSIPGSSSSSSSAAGRRASDASPFRPKHEKSGSTASKIFSKITPGNRSRSGSTASSNKNVSFSPTNQFISSRTSIDNASSSATSLPTVPEPVEQLPPPVAPVTPASATSAAPSVLSPTTTAPAITTLTDHRAAHVPSPEMRSAGVVPDQSSDLPGLPRLSMDMAPLAPASAQSQAQTKRTSSPPRLARADTGASEATIMPSYAPLDSDEED